MFPNSISSSSSSSDGPCVSTGTTRPVEMNCSNNARRRRKNTEKEKKKKKGKSTYRGSGPVAILWEEAGSQSDEPSSCLQPETLRRLWMSSPLILRWGKVPPPPVTLTDGTVLFNYFFFKYVWGCYHIYKAVKTRTRGNMSSITYKNKQQQQKCWWPIHRVCSGLVRLKC